MQLVSVEKKEGGTHVRLSGLIRRMGSEEPLELYFEYPREFAAFVTETADAFAPPLLLVAMASGEVLTIQPPVSRTLLAGFEHIQEVFEQWYPEFFKHSQVTAQQPHEQPRNKKDQSASFFSLGVDSFYTLLKARAEPITHIVYMLGMEQPLRFYEDGKEERVIARMREVAAQAGVTLIVGKTNLREVFPLPYSSFHGAGLAGVAHSLAGGFDTVYIPATHSYRDLFPWGSHPLTDSLWSSEGLSVVHDGAEAGRAQKLSRSLVHSELALSTLRVCTKNKGGLENCGRCDKCVRTMTTLKLLGVLEKATTFPSTLPNRFIAKPRRYADNDLSFLRENLDIAREVGARRKEIRLLERTLLKGQAQVLSQGHSFFGVQAALFRWYLWERYAIQLEYYWERAKVHARQLRTKRTT
jgi:hypothetical protein